MVQPLVRRSLEEASKYRQLALMAQEKQFDKPCISNYILACIHTKDAICLAFLGRSGSSKRHLDAVQELSSTGKVSKKTLGQFADLLRAKSEIQYDSAPMPKDRVLATATKAERFLQTSFDLLGFKG